MNNDVRKKSLDWFYTKTKEEKVKLIEQYLPNRPFTEDNYLTGREIEKIYKDYHLTKNFSQMKKQDVYEF